MVYWALSAQAVLLTLGALDTVFLLHLFFALLGNIISYDSCGRNKIISILAASGFSMNGNSALRRVHIMRLVLFTFGEDGYKPKNLLAHFL